MVGRLKPPLDFYYAYRQWIVRYYPEHIKQPGTPPQQKTWDAMLDACDGWNYLWQRDQQAWTDLVRNAMRTGKDFFYRCRLTGATKTPYIWHTIRVKAIWWTSFYVGIWAKRDDLKNWRAYYCNQEKQHSTFYWKDEGYCIRGRRMSVKRNLIEQWDNYVNREFLCIRPYICYRIPISPKDKTLYITFKMSPPYMIADHGRTGVYITRRP